MPGYYVILVLLSTPKGELTLSSDTTPVLDFCKFGPIVVDLLMRSMLETLVRLEVSGTLNSSSVFIESAREFEPLSTFSQRISLYAPPPCEFVV